MGKTVDSPISRVEFAGKVERHAIAIRKLLKRFNPDASHFSLAIVGDSQWAITYLPDDEDGRTRKISDWYRKLTDADGCKPFYKSEPIPDGKFVYLRCDSPAQGDLQADPEGGQDVQALSDDQRKADEGSDDQR